MGKLGQSVADFASLMMEAKESPSYACKRCHSAVSYVGMGQQQDQLRTSLQQLILESYMPAPSRLGGTSK